MTKPKLEIVSENLVWLDFADKEIRIEQDDFYNKGNLMITVHNKNEDYHAKLLVSKRDK